MTAEPTLYEVEADAALELAAGLARAALNSADAAHNALTMAKASERARQLDKTRELLRFLGKQLDLMANRVAEGGN